MSTQLEANTCDVVLLVPHGSIPATVLCESTATTDGSPIALPGIRMQAEPAIADIVARAEDLLPGSVVPLRANSLSWHENFDAASMVVEFESPTSDIPPEFQWSTIEESDVAAIAPEWVRDSVRAWLDEQHSGWHELRPQWSRPGWLSVVSPWMTDQMKNAGYVDPEVPRVHQLWGASIVLRAMSRNGTAYLKCSGDRFRTEPVVTQALAKASPGLLPDVLAVEPSRGWLLMRDFEGADFGDRPEDEWLPGLDPLVRLQKDWIGRTDELLALGAENRPLSDLIPWVEGTAKDTELLGRLSVEEREEWLESLPSMVEACLRLEEVGPGSTLVHGDFHPWNVVECGDGMRVFDWTDASVGHPLVDAVTYIMRAYSHEHRETMMNHYLDLWSDKLHGSDRAELCRLTLVVGGLFQAQTYVRLLPTIMPADVGQLGDGDAEWMGRTLRMAKQGLHAKY